MDAKGLSFYYVAVSRQETKVVRLKYEVFYGLKQSRSQSKPACAAHPHRLAIGPASELRTPGCHYLLQVKQRSCLTLALISADILPPQLPRYLGVASGRPGAP